MEIWNLIINISRNFYQNELEFQKRTHKKFTDKYGGKVFYIISVKEGKKKIIHNPEVIDELKEEIKRLQQN